MLISMTGFGRGEASLQSSDGATISITVEARSVNSRFIEISVRLPRSISERELEVRETVRKKFERGKIAVNVSVTRQGAESIPLTINESTAKAYFQLLDKLRTVTGITAEIQLRDLTSFGEIFQSEEAKSDAAKQEWEATVKALAQSLDNMNEMRKQEGRELEKDLRARLADMDRLVTEIEGQTKATAQQEFDKLKERVVELTKDVNVISNDRLEFEIAMVAERLDITEEIVRFRSHVKFFLEAVEAPEPAGRKLNFILQEMNREVNTMGSKTNMADVAHRVVNIKQELEKIREQVQNIE
jgi:uncharacterized protein (TIGR00255 family)